MNTAASFIQTDEKILEVVLNEKNISENIERAKRLAFLLDSTWYDTKFIGSSHLLWV